MGGAGVKSTPDYGEPWSADERPQHDALFIKDSTPLCLMFRKGGFAQRASACVNACAGMADPAKEISAMREAIREAVRTINLAKNSLHIASDPKVKAQWSENCMENKLCNSALAKLQPFIQ